MTPVEDEEFLARRAELVADVFEQVSFRPGAALCWGGTAVEVFEQEVPDRDSGEFAPRRWVDQELGALVSERLADPAVSDADLVDFVVLCAASAAVRNDVHELCEFFCVDGVRVFDPHPHRRRVDRAPVTVEVAGPGAQFPAWSGFRFDPEDLVEVPDRVVSRAASELVERVTAGPLGRFEVCGTQMTHVGVFCDRVSGERREFLWTREWSCDLTVPAAGKGLWTVSRRS